MPFSELNEHDTRLATALTDRSKIASGEGVFYTVQMEVTCETGTAPLVVSYAKLSTYVDPTAESISLISYSLDDGTLNVINAELTIVPAGQVTIVPTRVPEATSTEQQLIPTPVATLTATPSSAVATTNTNESKSQNQTTLIIVVLILVGLVIILLLVVFVLLRRSSRANNKD